jgi:hypothetical protein
MVTPFEANPDRADGEHDLRVVSDVEEVARAQVLVAPAARDRGGQRRHQQQGADLEADAARGGVHEPGAFRQHGARDRPVLGRHEWRQAIVLGVHGRSSLAPSLVTCARLKMVIDRP